MSNAQILSRSVQVGDGIEALLSRLVGAPVKGTLLASATRNASTTTVAVDWSGFRAAILYLNISDSSGTGGLRVFPEYQDPVSGQWRSPVILAAAITAAVMTPFFFGVGVGTGLSISINAGSLVGLPLGSAMRFRVTVGDATNYTYSLSYELL